MSPGGVQPSPEPEPEPEPEPDAQPNGNGKERPSPTPSLASTLSLIRYGDKGIPPIIPPSSALQFEVELLSVQVTPTPSSTSP